MSKENAPGSELTVTGSLSYEELIFGLRPYLENKSANRDELLLATVNDDWRTGRIYGAKKAPINQSALLNVKKAPIKKLRCLLATVYYLKRTAQNG
jgi:hypothetical protein